VLHTRQQPARRAWASLGTCVVHPAPLTNVCTPNPSATSGEQPPVVWVTIGLLAVEGLALQLKLKRADTPKERDKVRADPNPLARV